VVEKSSFGSLVGVGLSGGHVLSSEAETAWAQSGIGKSSQLGGGWLGGGAGKLGSGTLSGGEWSLVSEVVSGVGEVEKLMEVLVFEGVVERESSVEGGRRVFGDSGEANPLKSRRRGSGGREERH